MIKEFEKLIPESERLTSLIINLPYFSDPIMNQELLGATTRSAISGLNCSWREFQNERVYTHWSSLRELCLEDYILDNIDPRLFELFPKLSHLEICYKSVFVEPNTVSKLGRSFNGASNLISLKLHNFRCYQLEEYDFHAIVNLKQLIVKVDL
jgi:hypothetical protein